MGAAEKYTSTNSLDFDNIDENGDVIRKNVILMNSDVIEGAPYFTYTWFYKETGDMQETHTHDFDEHIGWVGTDPDDPTDLGATVVWFQDGEWITITKSTVIFIPAGIPHCPYRIKDVKRPIAHWSAGATGSYKQNK